MNNDVATKVLCMPILLVSLMTGIAAQAETGITTVPVRDGIYMLVGNGGNIGVLTGDDGTLMIDDQFADVSAVIQSALNQLGGDKPQFLLNTHYHGDHTGGNENFGKGGAIIVAHNNVRKRLSEPQTSEALGTTTPAAPAEALPVVTFVDDLRLYRNGESLHVIHINNAHTDGDSFVHFEKSNVIHTGDIFFQGRFPFIDYSAGGGIHGMIAGARKILDMADENTLIIPGHGELTNKEGLRTYVTMLETSRDRIQALKTEGKSLEDVIAARPLTEYDEKWSWGFVTPERWVTTVYKTL